MKTSYFTRPEGSLAYSDYGGTGELVIMLPGMGALRNEYRYLAPALSDAGYRAVTLDLRGQGESSVPWSAYDVPSVGGDILALIDHLGGGPAHVIGTSFAPAPAVWAAVERPESIRSLVLISPFVRVGQDQPRHVGAVQAHDGQSLACAHLDMVLRHSVSIAQAGGFQGISGGVA